MDTLSNTAASGFTNFSRRVDALPAPQPNVPAERVALNFADRLITLDDTPARFVAPSGVENFPNLVAFGEPGEEAFVAVNSFGDSKDAEGYIVQYVEPQVEHTREEIEEDDELDLVIDEKRVESGVITLPASLRLRVKHVKRGPGTVLKVREGDHARSLYIRSDRPDEHKGHAACYWALNRQLRDIASY